MINVNDFWQNLIDMIEEEGKKISQFGFDTWVKTIKPYSYKDDTLVLSVPMDINRNMIMQRYIYLIQSAANILHGKDLEIIIGLEDELDELADDSNFIIQSTPIDESFYLRTGLIKKYTFDNFVIGENNRFAWAGARAIAEAPGTCYNPFFLYGYVGLGKTHLMHAIGNEILKNDPTKRVLYLSCETFVTSVIDSIKDNTMSELRDKYRNLDVLMIDDIQFISKKERCQEEFFNTFNHLYNSGKHIIISSDRLPSEISELDDRIRSRLIEGLTCDLKQPDYETRVAIIKKKIMNDNLEISDELVNMIADRVKANIRELEGVITKIGAYYSLTSKKATKEMVTEIINEISGSKVRKVINSDTIIYEIAKYFDKDPKDIKSASRKTEIKNIRQICMYVMKEVADLSTVKIGEAFGRDHATVIHSVNKVIKDMETDERLKNKVEDIVSNIKDMM